MKKLNILLAICGISLIMLSACEDFLDREPLSDITPETYLIDESHLAAYAINLYTVFPNHATLRGYGTFSLDRHTDNQANQSYDNRYSADQYQVGASGESWSFSSIYQCNYFLKEVIPRFHAGTLSGLTDNINHYIGEVYFFRAYNYFQKLMALGDVPIMKTTFADNAEVLIEESKRMPRNEVARFIISDLDSAILLMSDVPPGGNNRLSKNVGLLMKSRVALFEATWLKYFAGTAFVPNGTGWPGKNKDYNSSYSFPSGSIDGEIEYFLTQAIAASKVVADDVPLVTNTGFLQQSVSDPVNPYFNMYGEVDLSGYPEVLLWRRMNQGLNIGDYTTSHNVCVSAMWANSATGVTRGMVDGFLMANGLPIYAAGSGYAGDDSIHQVVENRDGRLQLFLKVPGSVNLLWPYSGATASVFFEPYPNITHTSYDHKATTGYLCRKGMSFNGADNIYGFSTTGSITFRAVEAYLNYIEAYYEKNGNLDATAQGYWQAVRTRGGVDPDFNNTIANTDVAMEAPNDWGAYSANQLVDATLFNIRRERRCELFAEGLRWMDLKRWRAMDQMITTPYHIEGFKLWGPMQNWYSPTDITYDIGDASTVSSPSRSMYLRPYETTTSSLLYDGYRWKMAHYLSPIAIQHFLLSTSDLDDLTQSPIYQNPYWPIEAGMPATQ